MSAEETTPFPLKLIECPRDAMQGWKKIIPTETKAAYINSLLRVGFDTLDFGSFVSAKAIPQMADTKEVIEKLDIGNTSTKLLAIIANSRGAEEAAAFNQITYLGFPFSISETFQQRNTNSSIQESLKRVDDILTICAKNNKIPVIYISMGFGNPYGDPYSEQVVMQWVNTIAGMGVKIISLADTVGLATAAQVYEVTHHVIKNLPNCEIGVHLHSSPVNWKEKVDAALKAGCVRFDGALKGIGGCPMANDELVGNMDSELMIPYFQSLKLLPALNEDALRESIHLAAQIFN
jgi:hydroxymethylglutaryl-CoA lyase